MTLRKRVATSLAMATFEAVKSEFGRFNRAEICLRDTGVGIQTVPELIEYNARENASHPFCIQSRKSGTDGSSSDWEFITISHLQLKQSILRCSSWLCEGIEGMRLPRKNSTTDQEFVKGPPVALFMESDFGLLVHQLSLVSLGVPVG